MVGDLKVELVLRFEIINCIVCDKIFSIIYGYKMYMERFYFEILIKKSKKKYFKCKICGK